MPGLDAAWPITLLALRIAAVGVLYLFLARAFSALRAELLPWSPAPTSVPAEPFDDLDWPPSSRPAPAPSSASAPAKSFGDPRRIPLRVAIPSAGAALVLLLGSLAALWAFNPAGETTSVSSPPAASEPSGPPAQQPAPGRVTVGLAALEDSQVRVTVDGVVQFDGTLRADEQQAWEGSERIQVWTDRGKTLQLAVNGTDLGAYSPAMGHPDWNRIDFGFWPGWAQ